RCCTTSHANRGATASLRAEIRLGIWLKLNKCGLQSSRLYLIVRDDLIKARIGHDALHKLSVHGVSGFFSHDAAKERPTDERQITNQVEGFVPAGLIEESETTGIRHFTSRKTDRIVHGRAPDQPHVAHRVELIFKAKG